MTTKFEKFLAMHCSPAICGIKSSNLVNCSRADFPDPKRNVEELNRIFYPKISFTILNVEKKRVLLLVYQKEKLSKTLFNCKNYEYLIAHDYPKEKEITKYLSCLKGRIKDYDTFPHEIGVFLGYALEDIIDFQEGSKECVYIGYWKVYSRKEEKIEIFNRYTKCRNIVTKLLEKGYHLEAIV